MKKTTLEAVQKQIVDLVVTAFPQVYLVGGTAISLIYGHRLSEDLDFFTHDYSGKLHRDIVTMVKKITGYKYQLVAEEARKQYLPMAVYEFAIGKDQFLKVDFVKDVIPLISPRDSSGVASVDDLYYRKIMAVVGWKAGESSSGRMLSGGRQKTKDLYDVYFLSTHAMPLSEWFPKYFEQPDYERLAAWYLSIPKQKAVLELMDLVTDCDTRAIFKYLDDEIIHKLNRKYANI